MISELVIIVHSYPKEFWFALLLGCFVIALFAFGEFDRPTFKRENTRPETFFLPPELTTRRDYLISFILYLVGLEAVYLAICIVGPRPFTEAFLAHGAAANDGVPGSELTFISTASFPLSIAITLVGVVPRLPFFAYVEEGWRRLMHERASIPQAALALARDLRLSTYDLGRFADYLTQENDRFAKYVRPHDLQCEPHTSSYKWARLSNLVWRLSSLPDEPEARDHVDLLFFERYRADLAAICYEHAQLGDQIASARLLTEKKKPQKSAADEASQVSAAVVVPDNFRAAIDSMLNRIYIFLACSLIACPPSQTSLKRAKLFLGFAPTNEHDHSREMDVVLKALLSMAALVFLVVFVAPYLIYLLPQSLHVGWPAASDVAFIWAASALIMHGSAVYTALALRRFWRRRHAWFRGTSKEPQLPATSRYVLSVSVGYVISLSMLYYWNGALVGFGELGRDIDKLFAFAFVSSASALFVSLLLDRAAIGSRMASQLKFVGAQIFVSAFLGWAAAINFRAATQEVIGDSGDGAIAFTVFVAAVIGGSIGVVTAVFAKQEPLRIVLELDYR